MVNDMVDNVSVEGSAGNYSNSSYATNANNNRQDNKKTFLQLVDEKNLSINGDGFVLMNGGFGTWLEFANRLGKVPFENEKYNFWVSKLVRRYIESGSRIVGTHTFGTNYRELEKSGNQHLIKKLNLEAVENLYRGIELAKEQEFDDLGNDFPEEFLTYISIGPSACYRDSCMIDSVNQASSYHAPQIEALLSRDGTFGVDFIQAETIPEPKEVSGLIKEIRKYDENIVVIPSFHLSKSDTKLGYLSATGQTTGEAIDEIEQDTGEQLEVMINCCDMETIKKGIMLKDNTHLDRIVGIYPNPHHETEYQKDGSVRLQTYNREELRELMRDFSYLKKNYTENLTAVAICCGATPDDIALLNELLHPLHPASHRSDEGISSKSVGQK